jgi:hypothetical protein
MTAGGRRAKTRRRQTSIGFASRQIRYGKSAQPELRPRRKTGNDERNSSRLAHRAIFYCQENTVILLAIQGFGVGPTAKCREPAASRRRRDARDRRA